MSDDNDDNPATDVTDAAHAAIGGVQSALEDLTVRLDTIAQTQAATLEHIIRLQPVTAIETELGGDANAIDPPTPTAIDEAAASESALRRFHNTFG